MEITPIGTNCQEDYKNRTNTMGGCVSTLKNHYSTPGIIMRDSSLSCLTATDRPNFHIVSLETSIENKLTELDESTCLKYRTPHFRARAVVSVPRLAGTQIWQIGWIQACDRMEFTNTYGEDGCTSWEFPELLSGKQKMISDSDGTHYPWYGSRTEVKNVLSPCDAKRVTVSVSDNFFPKITWKIPLTSSRDAYLTRVTRDQGFYTWLVAKNLIANRIYVLKTIRWEMSLDIAVDVNKPLGQRATLMGPMAQKQPEVLQNDITIPHCALLEPNANSAQRLVWRGSDGDASVLVPPRLRDIKCSSDCLICCTEPASPENVQIELTSDSNQSETADVIIQERDRNGNTISKNIQATSILTSSDHVMEDQLCPASRSPISNNG